MGQMRSKTKIAWLIPQGENLNWSSALRLRRLDIYRELSKDKYNDVCSPKLFREYMNTPIEVLYEEIKDYDAILFAEQSEYDYLLMSRLRENQVRPLIIRDHCENIWGFPWEAKCFYLSDIVVCSSYKLQEIARSYQLNNLVVIEEHYEKVDNLDPKPNLLGYMGTDGKYAEYIATLAKNVGWDVEILCRPDNNVQGSIEWTVGNWKEHFRTYSALIAPQRPEMIAKSPAKVIQGLGNGMPVIASNVDSYRRYVRNGIDGYICDTLEDWSEAFKNLRVHMEMLRENAKQSYIKYDFSLQSIAMKWLSLFNTKHDF